MTNKLEQCTLIELREKAKKKKIKKYYTLNKSALIAELRNKSNKQWGGIQFQLQCSKIENCQSENPQYIIESCDKGTKNCRSPEYVDEIESCQYTCYAKPRPSPNSSKEEPYIYV